MLGSCIFLVQDNYVSAKNGMKLFLMPSGTNSLIYESKVKIEMKNTHISYYFIWVTYNAKYININLQYY